jgi:hypothetical protein
MPRNPDENDRQTPVDEVRRVRERRHREAQGDIHKLVGQSRKAVERFRTRLKLKVVAPPTEAKRRKVSGG